MSHYIVSARKYRPSTFDSVVGQHAVTNTLKNAIRTGQVAHAYLFCGSRGVGKTTCARIFAKTLNCFHPTTATEACGECDSCRSFNESRSVNIHELDAASNNTIEDIRSLIEKVRILPQLGKYSIYIIDEVHMLSQSAFNAFLKTLEEPPAHAIFILATTEKHKILPTILSRCQIFDFHRIRVEDIVKYMAKVAETESIVFEEEALNVIALKSDGSMRDALSVFDQVASFSEHQVTYKNVIENLNVLDFDYYFKGTGYFLEEATAQSLLLFNEILQHGFDGLNYIQGLASHFRDLLVCKDESTLTLLEVSDSLKMRYKQQALKCTQDFLFTALELCNQCENTIKGSRNQRLHIELSLIRLCNIATEKKNYTPEQGNIVIPELTTKKILSGKEESKPVQEKNEVSLTAGKENKKQEKEAVYAGPSVSIKDALKHIENPVSYNSDVNLSPDEINNDSGDEALMISEEKLNQSWNRFTTQLRDDKPRMAITLKNVKPVVSADRKIYVEFNNTDQVEDFNRNIRAEMEKHLCNDLQIKTIIVEPVVMISENLHKNKLYTSEEKFRYLSEKNPVLNELRKKFNLELE